MREMRLVDEPEVALIHMHSGISIAKLAHCREIYILVTAVPQHDVQQQAVF